MDIGSLVGIVSGLVLIFSAIILGGDLASFIHIPGIMIVCGGTMSATLLNFQFKDVVAALKAAYFVFNVPHIDPNDMVFSMVNLGVATRKNGILALSNVESEHPLIKKACNLIADGTDEELIYKTLHIEIESMRLRHMNIQEVFKKLGTYAPSFGMLGTLIGMVQMLGEISSPETIGPAMATALLTTFYGSLLSSMIFIPIAGKLKSRTITEVINLKIIFEGAISILANNSPLFVYEKLSAHIPKKMRRPLKIFAEKKEREQDPDGR